jgi:hypothetical protein
LWEPIAKPAFAGYLFLRRWFSEKKFKGTKEKSQKILISSISIEEDFMSYKSIRLILALILITILGLSSTQYNVLAQEIPMIEANIGGDWVAAYGLTGSTAILEVYDPGSSEAKCSQEFDLAEYGSEIWMDCWEPMVQPGDLVLLFLDGAQVKDHTAYDLTLDTYDPGSGYFAGTAQLETTVRVEFCNPPPDEYSDWECFMAETPTSSSGTWEVTFGTVTISPDAWYGAFISDDDGDQTFAELSPTPNIEYNLINTCLGINNFPADQEVLVEAYTDDTMSELIFSEPLFTEGHGGAGMETMNGLEPGNFIMANYGDGEIVKDLVLQDLTLDYVDFEADQAGGFASEGAEVILGVDGGEVGYFEAPTTADSGGWFIDFSSEYGIDLTEDMDFWVHVDDEDGDMTIAILPIPASPPSIMVFPESDWVDATGWPVGETITLIIDDDFDPSTPPLYVTTGEPIEAPWNPDDTWVGFDISPYVDLVPGYQAIIISADDFRFHVITEISVAEIDPTANTITGSAQPLTDLFLMINWMWETEVWLTAEPDGLWQFDYSGITDFGHGDLVVACQMDDDGDMTCITRSIVTPGGLIDEILNMPPEVLDPEINHSLVVKIENAISSLTRGNSIATINKLQAFINQVEALRGDKISDDAADYLIWQALHLIASLE